MKVPKEPKIYHITHYDRLPSIIANGALWCDAVMSKHTHLGTTIGMSAIKRRRLYELTFSNYPDLFVGQCVPFYFCPRSIMLYIIHCANNPELLYKGGQIPIVHLQIDLYAAINWANANQRRWAFTDSNAGSNTFQDFCDIEDLKHLDWDAIEATSWSECKYNKQAEFLVEGNFPWTLVEYIGMHSKQDYRPIDSALSIAAHRPPVYNRQDWYY